MPASDLFKWRGISAEAEATYAEIGRRFGELADWLETAIPSNADRSSAYRLLRWAKSEFAKALVYDGVAVDLTAPAPQGTRDSTLLSSFGAVLQAIGWQRDETRALWKSPNGHIGITASKILETGDVCLHPEVVEVIKRDQDMFDKPRHLRDSTLPSIYIDLHPSTEQTR